MRNKLNYIRNSKTRDTKELVHVVKEKEEFILEVESKMITAYEKSNVISYHMPNPNILPNFCVEKHDICGLIIKGKP